MVFGTRPEAIKMVPLIKLFQSRENFHFKLCITAQHREMLDQVLTLFEIYPDYDLNIMSANQDLYDITSRILLGMRSVLNDFKPDLVLVHGDTTTSFIAALAGFYEHVPVGHVEAGLRTGDIYSPWPEEANRKMLSTLAQHHFSPTQESKKNLLKENIDAKKIIVTGNTVIDTLFLILKEIEENEGMKEAIVSAISSQYRLTQGKKIILVTGHRRENFGESFIHICQAIKQLAKHNPDIDIVYPVHLNPHVQAPVHEILGEIENVFLLKPLAYEQFVYLMSQSYLILTDSGGIQEEAPSLGKPVLVMRNETERPEAITAGTVKLVGTEEETIVEAVQVLLDNPAGYLKMSQAYNPYGDGKASECIMTYLEEVLFD